MKVLQLCKKFPFPLKDGETIAVTHLSKALYDLGCEVTLLAMNTTKHHYNNDKMPNCLNHYKEIHFTELDNSIKPTEAFKNLFSKDSYHIVRFISEDFKKLLIELLQKEAFDVIQLETLYLAPYIPTIRKYSKAKIALRAHNVEHEIWQRVTNHTTLLPKKWYLSHLTKKLKNYEVNQLDKFDLLIPITNKDLKTFQSLGFNSTAVTTPIGLDTRTYHPNNRSFKRDISLSFIGSLDWMPNLEGLKWFLENIWDSLNKQYPDLKLHVAGRNTPEWLSNLKINNVTIHGEVNDAHKFINRHSVMIVPLKAGSGMRAKILEGMALGKVVVTTSLGLEGINAEHKKEVLIADTVDEFKEAIEFCYKSNGSLGKIGQNAQKLASKKYDNLETAKNLVQAYEVLTGKKVEVVEEAVVED